MTNHKQSQKSSDNSLNVQAGRDVHVGLGYADVKAIALDVFQANFYNLSEEASNLAKERAEELTTSFLKELSEKKPESLQNMSDPDMQYALYTAQKEYARHGDKEISEVLVDVLIERAASPDRSLLQIVMNESLDVVSKLTNDQLDTLSLIFILRYTKKLNIGNTQEFEQYIMNTILPLVNNLHEEESHYQHLEYAGCGTVGVSSLDISDAMKKNYLGIFVKGFTLQEYNDVLNGENLTGKPLIRCLHDKNLYQLNALSEDDVKEKCLASGADNQLSNKLLELQKSKTVNNDEIKRYVEGIHPQMKMLLDVWNKSSMSNVTLTSVGIALAHANIKRKTNQRYDISIWIQS